MMKSLSRKIQKPKPDMMRLDSLRCALRVPHAAGDGRRHGPGGTDRRGWRRPAAWLMPRNSRRSDRLSACASIGPGRCGGHDLGAGSMSSGMIAPGEHRRRSRRRRPKATPTSHQICQIKAETHDAGEEGANDAGGAVASASRFPRISASSLQRCRVAALARCLMRPNRRPRRAGRCGSTAKLKTGGGEAVDHSSVREFQGSPVTSAQFAARSRMLTYEHARFDRHDSSQYRQSAPNAGNEQPRPPFRQRRNAASAASCPSDPTT